jgi:MFS family permease
LIRIHGVERGDVGVQLGYITILAGPAGILFGGWLGDRLTRAGYLDAKIRVGLTAAFAWAPFGIGYALSPNLPLAAVLLTVAIFIVAMPWGAAPAAIQDVMPPQMRGQASAVYLFVINLLGLGL